MTDQHTETINMVAITLLIILGVAFDAPQQFASFCIWLGEYK